MAPKMCFVGVIVLQNLNTKLINFCRGKKIVEKVFLLLEKRKRGKEKASQDTSWGKLKILKTLGVKATRTFYLVNVIN